MFLCVFGFIHLSDMQSASSGTRKCGPEKDLFFCLFPFLFFCFMGLNKLHRTAVIPMRTLNPCLPSKQASAQLLVQKILHLNYSLIKSVIIYNRPFFVVVLTYFVPFF